jgi:hypothetical protein
MSETREVIEGELIAAIEAYLADTGESITSFCRRVAGDPSLLSDLRNGRGIGPRLRRRIDAALTTTEKRRA